MSVYQGSNFSRVRANEAKMGAYYTDLSHCHDISKMFIWPEEEVSVLEPSIGDASAVIEVTGAQQNENIKIFGVELNDEVADVTAKNPHVEALLKADFTNGIMVRKSCFSFCFANPPYLTERYDDGEQTRLEKQFLERIINYLKPNGILVWVVSYKQFFEAQHVRMWMRNFETLAMYRFRPEEFQKFSQIVVVGRKKPKGELSATQVGDYLSKYYIDKLENLPHDITPWIPVIPSASSGVDLFTTREFRAEDVFAYLDSNGLSKDIITALDRRIAVKCFSEGELKRPPIPVKNDSLFLLVASGVGQGFTGSEENGDLHLQRGVAEVIEESHIPSSEDEYGDEEETHTGRMVVTTRTAISMTVLENDGTIHVLS